jgi:hypothetical protein
LSVDGLLAYGKRKGMDIYFYDSEYPRDVYKKYTVEEAKKKSFPPLTFTKDLGETFTSQEFNTINKEHYFYYRDIERHDPDLIAVVEELGEAADGSCSKLKVVEVPDGVEYEIEEYDGNEWVAEVHRRWS